MATSTRAFPEAWDGTGGPRRNPQVVLDEPAGAPDLEVIDGGKDAAEVEKPALENSPDVDKEIRARIQKIEDLMAKRRSLNEEVSAEFNALKAMGLRKDTVRYIIKMRAWDEDTRAEYDMSERIIRHAVGLPRQGELFN